MCAPAVRRVLPVALGHTGLRLVICFTYLKKIQRSEENGKYGVQPFWNRLSEINDISLVPLFATYGIFVGYTSCGSYPFPAIAPTRNPAYCVEQMGPYPGIAPSCMRTSKCRQRGDMDNNRSAKLLKEITS